MSLPHFKTITEQVADHLRKELLGGQWIDGMPGQKRLSKQLGISGQTAELALQLLEKEGLLVGQGAGRQRRVERFQGPTENRALRVRILLYEKPDRKSDYLVELFHRLQDAGHDAGFATKTMGDLGMDLKRIARFIEATEADAWVVVAGPRDVLGWFAARSTPAFALFGRMPSVPIAGTGPLKSPAMSAAVRRLAELGHRRIVMLTREERRKPEPGRVERVFLEELRGHGIATGPYNLPDWVDDPKGFHRCLCSLFNHTPPTALIISTLELYAATQQFLCHRGIRVPQNVSMICSDPNPTYAWCDPTFSHIAYDSAAWPRNIMRWLNNVAHGKDDRRQIFTKAEFIDGGTVGPVPTGR
jgi:DNA-binding LacI/PurR family transcriptional regulator